MYFSVRHDTNLPHIAAASPSPSPILIPMIICFFKVSSSSSSSLSSFALSRATSKGFFFWGAWFLFFLAFDRLVPYCWREILSSCSKTFLFSLLYSPAFELLSIIDLAAVRVSVMEGTLVLSWFRGIVSIAVLELQLKLRYGLQHHWCLTE